MRYRRFRRGKAPLPILPLIGGVVAPMLDSLEKSNFMSDVQTDPMKAIKGLTDQISQHYIGISPFGFTQGFNMQYLIPTYTGLLAGIAGHMIAQKLGVNRQFKRVPFIGKYVQL